MALAGKKGKLSIGNSDAEALKVIGIKNWSLSLMVDSIEKTYLGDDWKSYILGLKSWTASSDGDYSVTSASTNTELEQNQELLQNAYLNGTTITAKFYVDETNYYSGQAIITALNISDPVDGVVSISMDLTGCGTLSFN